MPRICILSQYFPPEIGAPQARLSELGERLLDRGWEVDVLTSLPNYPGGRVAPGYPLWSPVRERVGRLDVTRVPLLPSSQGFVRRLICYYSFAASASALGTALLERPDVLLFESPPLFLGHAALELSRRWRCPLVMNVSDLWPDSAVRMGIIGAGTLPARFAEAFELHLYRRAAGVCGQSDEIIESVRRRSPGVNAVVVSGGVDPSRFSAAAPRELSLPRPTFVFAGLMGHAQGLDQVLDLAAALGPQDPGSFLLVGDGPRRAELEQRVRRDGLRRVHFMPPQPRDAIPGILAAADAAIITLGHRLPGAVPSKLYEAMAAGLPILLVAEGEPERRTLAAGAGLVVPPGDREGLKRAFLRLANDDALRKDLGRSGRVAAETVYSRDSIADTLDTFLRGITESRVTGSLA